MSEPTTLTPGLCYARNLSAYDRRYPFIVRSAWTGDDGKQWYIVQQWNERTFGWAGPALMSIPPHLIGYYTCAADPSAAAEEALDPAGRIDAALRVALEDGQIDGAHHKMWVIDQMVRHLCASPADYDALVGELDGWDTGVAP